jgi:hypothetical protein
VLFARKQMKAVPLIKTKEQLRKAETTRSSRFLASGISQDGADPVVRGAQTQALAGKAAGLHGGLMVTPEGAALPQHRHTESQAGGREEIREIHTPSMEGNGWTARMKRC